MALSDVAMFGHQQEDVKQDVQQVVSYVCFDYVYVICRVLLMTKPG